MTQESLKSALIQECKENQDYCVSIRRQIHAHPEIMFEEYATQSLIEEELKKLGFSTQKTAKTGLIAIIEGSASSSGLCIALRADMDALNITEDTDAEYVSKIPGKMHACGHDAHVACLLGAARVISRNREKLIGKVKLIFQPAEEGGGGAKFIIDEGHLADVDRIFGIHVWHPSPSGEIGTLKGPMMASADMFKITVQGTGGHAAFPHLAVDPTVVTVEIYDALQKLVTREINPLHTTLITTPEFHGSKAGNIIASSAILTGTLRTFDQDDRKHILERIEQIITHYSQAWRCEAKLEFIGMAYPSVVNDPKIVDEVADILEDLGGIHDVEPTMGGEDFAFYQQTTAKGVFLFLGIYNEPKGIIHPHHHPQFDIDEDILWKGAAIYSLLAFYSNFKKNK
ncbi:MAG: M20 metallopeptidase family protein [Promethearchaeota archaeon]